MAVPLDSNNGLPLTIKSHLNQAVVAHPKRLVGHRFITWQNVDYSFVCILFCYWQGGTDRIDSEYDSIADTCAATKRTPSRASVLSTYSSRKRRRISVASPELGRDLATPLTPETPIEETNVRAPLGQQNLSQIGIFRQIGL